MNMKKYTIVCKNDDQALTLKNEMQQLLAGKMKEDAISPDFVVSIGGDGTLLKSIHQYERENTGVFNALSIRRLEEGCGKNA